MLILRLLRSAQGRSRRVGNGLRMFMQEIHVFNKHQTALLRVSRLKGQAGRIKRGRLLAQFPQRIRSVHEERRIR